MPRGNAPALRQAIADGSAQRSLFDRDGLVRLAELAGGSSLGGGLDALAGRSVLLATAAQLTTALALIELDGVARRLVILPPDADPGHFAPIVAGAEVDAVVVDYSSAASPAFDMPVRVVGAAPIVAAPRLAAPWRDTEWIMPTSGTTGAPKLVVHSRAGLTAAFAEGTVDEPTVWGTFYDIRRYGGLQIFLRAVLGGVALVLSSAGEPIGEHLKRLGRHGVTHLSGTPSHWRAALMSPAIGNIAPRYLRLSGEIADQVILDNLRQAFPRAVVGHAFASTEAGLAFEVGDGCAGFPAALVERSRDGVDLKVVAGSLRVRSPRAASRYIGGAAALADADGFIDTGDMVELRGDRYVFVGRRSGVINVGGLKVHPEEVEAVINRHPQVRMSRVAGKRSPITGAVVAAEVVLQSGNQAGQRPDAVKDDIRQFCRDELPLYKVPAAISIVPALDVAATGKLKRHHA